MIVNIILGMVVGWWAGGWGGGRGLFLDCQMARTGGGKTRLPFGTLSFLYPVCIGDSQNKVFDFFDFLFFLKIDFSTFSFFANLIFRPSLYKIVITIRLLLCSDGDETIRG